MTINLGLLIVGFLYIGLSVGAILNIFLRSGRSQL
jgi:hypothetical protein